MKAEQMALTQALMHMLQRATAGAFGTWCAVEGEEKCVWHLCAGIVRRMMNKKLSGVFKKWQPEATGSTDRWRRIYGMALHNIAIDWSSELGCIAGSDRRDNGGVF